MKLNNSVIKKLEKKALELLENEESSYKDLVWNTKPSTLSDTQDIIKKFKRGKAPGPNGITTDLVKDLDDDSLDEIRKLFRSWWLKRKYQTHEP